MYHGVRPIQSLWHTRAHGLKHLRPYKSSRGVWARCVGPLRGGGLDGVVVLDALTVWKNILDGSKEKGREE